MADLKEQKYIVEIAKMQGIAKAAENLFIVCITAKELLQLNSAQECKRLMIEKWNDLQNSVDIASII